MGKSTLIDRLGLIYKQLLAKELVQNKEDFADKLGYSPTYVSELFSGRREISNKFQLKVENVFGVQFTEPAKPVKQEAERKVSLPTKAEVDAVKSLLNNEALAEDILSRLRRLEDAVFKS